MTTQLEPDDQLGEPRHRIVYGRRDRPLVEVRVDGVWCRGRLCYRVENTDGAWWMRVTYRFPGRSATLLGRFASHEVRPPSLEPGLGGPTDTVASRPTDG